MYFTTDGAGLAEAEVAALLALSRNIATIRLLLVEALEAFEVFADVLLLDEVRAAADAAARSIEAVALPVVCDVDGGTA